MEINVSYCKRMAQIGEKIKLARSALGMTQEALAKEVGVEPPSVSRWENGASKPRPRQIPLLAKVLGKPADWFLKDENAGLDSIQKRIVALEAREGSSAIPPELSAAWKKAGEEKWRQAIAMFFLTGDESHLEKDVPKEFRKRLLEGLRFYHMGGAPKARAPRR